MSRQLLTPPLLCLLILGACASEITDTSVTPEDNQGEYEAVADAFPRAEDVASTPPPAENPPPGPTEDGPPAVPPHDPDPTTDIVCLDVGAPDQYPSCCDEGPARCVPTDLIPEPFHEVVAACDGGLCIPEPMFDLAGLTGLTPCSSVAGVEGACLSRCVPEVAVNAALLPQDICGEGDLCVPCVSPLDGLDTGVCTVWDCNNPKTDDDPAPEPEPEPEPGYSCDNPPAEPLVDPTMFPPCCDGARCIPTGLVPEDQHDSLDMCDDGASLCVPEPFIAWGDFYEPTACALGDGSPGRCMSTCLPDVAARIDQLPQANCADNERCSPCCDFYSGEPSGSCGFACDTWEEEDGTCDVVYETCCEDNGGGHCIPADNIPGDLLDSVESLGCGQDNVCVPDEVTDPNIGISVCTGSIPFLNEPYEGVCLSKCLKLPLDILIWSGSCPKTHDCVPCTDPLTGGPSGAPGCDQL